MEVLIKTDFLTYLRSVEVNGSEVHHFHSIYFAESLSTTNIRKQHATTSDLRNNPRANCGVPLRVDEAFYSASQLGRRWPSSDILDQIPSVDYEILLWVLYHFKASMSKFARCFQQKQWQNQQMIHCHILLQCRKNKNRKKHSPALADCLKYRQSSLTGLAVLML